MDGNTFLRGWNLKVPDRTHPPG